MSDPVIVVCEAGASRCGAGVPPSAQRLAQVRAKLDEARALLEPVGLWAGAPVIALDARPDGWGALTVVDAAAEGLVDHAGRPAILFSTGTEADLDVLLHELTHVWMRTRGANDARWRLEDGRATHQSALVHEGIADFVTAALTGDPIIAEGLPAPYSIRPVARCPDGLTGQPHADSLIVSNALWELGGAGKSPTTMSEVLAAVARSAVDGSGGLDALVAAMTRNLAGHPTLASRWEALVTDRGLKKCHEPLEIREGRVSARAGDFMAAGTERFGVDEVTGPLHFTASVTGTKTLKITGRSSRDALSVDWQARDAQGHVLEKGRVPLEGWPSAFTTLSLPPASHTLTFGFVTSQPHDVTFNNVGVTPLETYPAITAASSPAPRSGCALGGPADLVVPLLLGWLMRRRAPTR